MDTINITTYIGLAAGGTGNILFTATNSGTLPVVATITVTPTFTGGGISCPGPAMTFTITVYPLPVPVITGQTPVCVNVPNLYVYTTESGMTNYIWNAFTGATIT